MISVIIPTYNAEKTIGSCLEGLANQSVPPETYEVVVVDDGSTDGTKDVVEKFRNVKFIKQPHCGPAAARNCGAKHALGELFLFTDSDCVPTRNWIEKMITPFQAIDIVGVKGTYLSNQSSIVARFVQIEYEDKYNRMSREKYIDFIDTYSAGYRRDIFLENAGFDISFPTASVEDQEFSFRLARLGYKMLFVPEAQVYHLGHASNLITYALKKFWIGYWKVLVHVKHPDKLIRDTHTPQILKLQVLLSGGIVIFAVLGFISPINSLIASIMAIVFLATTIPFITFAWKKDRWVASITPFFLLIRALALGAGFAIGFLNHLIIQLDFDKRNTPDNRSG